jgi:hypothetical protein
MPEWQRITAGRGLYRDAELLVMDEPSSALVPRAEPSGPVGRPAGADQPARPWPADQAELKWGLFSYT